MVDIHRSTMRDEAPPPKKKTYSAEEKKIKSQNVQRWRDFKEKKSAADATADVLGDIRYY